MKKAEIKIIRVYEGTRTAKEVLAEVIAYKVRKKLDSDMEIRLEKNDCEDGNARKWIDLIREYSDITKLDADTLNRLISRIVVHENITEDGVREISLEIHYNFRPMDESKSYNLSDYAEAHTVAKAV